ncbi:anaerobic ribonucleoside-triphosphate reductase-activating protein [Moritella sp. F3]|uniref:anaerobic ribonucleoside-triphosphate reductase-activating protein n=1 Tax=Moritella sp. F3 TaxID=2718882 RepID=UPI0018E1A423|nr:anaerobic ribonucleoside-triphosphate reductase-activating protein [Moritella sp. F3]GIC75791.1 anaerobic ribonucleoside-triphosphate reductase-activating protein [Moritella sp. F1]GIC81761.1 anaerobic ribonucleoside-triphosphate reductase-activating protein [Moritella sp. F3]
MHYSQYYPVDVINGPGTRVTLFVSGCEHQCKGCYNQSTWSPRNGSVFTQAMEDKIINDLNDPRIRRKGLSLSGGDPLYLGNLEHILKLVKRVKKECVGKNVWLWTGYTIEQLTPEQKMVVQYVDYLVDGKFEQSLSDPALQFRGSSNQRIITILQNENIAEFTYSIEK